MIERGNLVKLVVVASGSTVEINRFRDAQLVTWNGVIGWKYLSFSSEESDIFVPVCNIEDIDNIPEWKDAK